MAVTSLHRTSTSQDHGPRDHRNTKKVSLKDGDHIRTEKKWQRHTLLERHQPHKQSQERVSRTCIQEPASSAPQRQLVLFVSSLLFIIILMSIMHDPLNTSRESPSQGMNPRVRLKHTELSTPAARARLKEQVREAVSSILGAACCKSQLL